VSRHQDIPLFVLLLRQIKRNWDTSQIVRREMRTDITSEIIADMLQKKDRLCGLVQTQRPGLYSRHYHISCEVVGLERGPLSLVSTIEELN
jgi:hypothetical protein